MHFIPVYLICNNLYSKNISVGTGRTAGDDLPQGPSAQAGALPWLTRIRHVAGSRHWLIVSNYMIRQSWSWCLPRSLVCRKNFGFLNINISDDINLRLEIVILHFLSSTFVVSLFLHLFVTISKFYSLLSSLLEYGVTRCFEQVSYNLKVI